MVRIRVAVLLSLLTAVLAALAGPAAAAPAVRATTVAGGDVLTGPGRCTLGFNVSGRGILAGPCGPVGTRWYAGATSVGVVTTVFAGTGLTLISIDNPTVTQLHGIRTAAGVGMITAAARSSVGQSVSVASPVSGVHTGTVTGINQTVNFPQGAVTGLDRSTVCTEAGSAGAPVFAGTTGLSMVVGGSGTCTSGGTTYAEPIVALLTRTGRSIY